MNKMGQQDWTRRDQHVHGDGGIIRGGQVIPDTRFGHFHAGLGGTDLDTVACHQAVAEVALGHRIDVGYDARLESLGPEKGLVDCGLTSLDGGPGKGHFWFRSLRWRGGEFGPAPQSLWRQRRSSERYPPRETLLRPRQLPRWRPWLGGPVRWRGWSGLAMQ